MTIPIHLIQRTEKYCFFKKKKIEIETQARIIEMKLNTNYGEDCPWNVFSADLQKIF